MIMRNGLLLVLLLGSNLGAGLQKIARVPNVVRRHK